MVVRTGRPIILVRTNERFRFDSWITKKTSERASLTICQLLSRNVLSPLRSGSALRHPAELSLNSALSLSKQRSTPQFQDTGQHGRGRLVGQRQSAPGTCAAIQPSQHHVHRPVGDGGFASLPEAWRSEILKAVNGHLATAIKS